jgi:hypothetical protein
MMPPGEHDPIEGSNIWDGLCLSGRVGPVPSLVEGFPVIRPAP